MATRHPFSGRAFPGIAAIAFAGLFVAGCQDRPTQSNTGPAHDSQLAALPDPQQRPSPADPRRDPATTGSPPAASGDALTAKINDYAQEMAGALDKRQQQKPQPAPTDSPQPADQQQPHQPADVKFVKPGTPNAQAKQQDASASSPPQVVALPQPVVDNQPSTANQQLSIATNGSPGAPTPAEAQSAMRVSPDDLNRTAAATPRPPPPAADLDAKFSKHIQEYPRDLWAHLDFQLLHFLRDEQVPQLDALTSLPLEDRELIAAVMDGLTNFRNGLRSDNNMLLSRKVKPLIELADRLRSQADLNIPTLALCTNVEAFGVYDPIDPVRFVAGREHQAIVYCEVENFSSAPLADSHLWETKLTQEAVLYTESGMPVWVDKAGNVIDRSRNRRHDFFIVKKITLPPALTIGRYLLKVTVQDQQAKRVAEQTMPVEIVAQMETAGAAIPARSVK